MNKYQAIRAIENDSLMVGHPNLSYYISGGNEYTVHDKRTWKCMGLRSSPPIDQREPEDGWFVVDRKMSVEFSIPALVSLAVEGRFPDYACADLERTLRERRFGEMVDAKRAEFAQRLQGLKGNAGRRAREEYTLWWIGHLKEMVV
jgi:hypothetical protein